MTWTSKSLRRAPKGSWWLLWGLWLCGMSVLGWETSKRGAHWAFQPLSSPPLPPVQNKGWLRNPIDAFVLDRLEREGLAVSPEADAATLLRRTSLGLTGLLPTPEQVSRYSGDGCPDAWERWIDELLRSPRYGERWAQQWLDLVRFADTDGFEVNTERRNAWPYRDYVIRAFNGDLPYDRFIREQLAGDLLGEDAATGFLVTAAALLPGQIGADDVSKRQARQDSLSEIVGGTGEALLGLSVGCARCHDHKFDPISQRDFYAMQAFFAGVKYGDRPMNTPEARARRQEAESLKPRLVEIQQALSQFEPMAWVGSPPRVELNARLNETTFTPREVRFVQFTIHDTQVHPNLGLIEPCLDEFEIFSAGENPRNVALASVGSRVMASGSKTSDAHRLEHLNDGRYGNGRSWMSDESGRGWVLFELPAPVVIDKIVWSRDREGTFSDRLPVAFTLEAGMSRESLQQIELVPPQRRAVNPRLNIDRFAPVAARRLRFSVTACTSLEPCLDELEVFSPGPEGRNVALASHGTKVTASGTLAGSAQHRLEHLNDGIYGNNRSWISSEAGRGWVELEFPQVERIGRVVWGRDREEKFRDRLPTEYRIEVAGADGVWHRVAGSTDRRKYVPDDKSPERMITVGLSEEETRRARQWLEEKKSIEARIAKLDDVPMVFGGVFQSPEATHLLHRGDPEQPKDRVNPAVLSHLGKAGLPVESSDGERRAWLADWIASPGNPLTARVLVNRIWQGHFGIGLVETSSDFGRSGSRPSHPELLDWLAGEFVRSGWSIKAMHRLILQSATYRQSSQMRPDAQARDANCRWLWRYPSRRLEAEMLRDCVLEVSGRLNLRMGGPGFNLFRSRGGLDGFPPIEEFGEEGLRRMIYVHKVRMERDPVFGAFDCPDAGQSLARRRQSTTPIQALNLFNSRFTLDMSTAFADRVRCEAGTDWRAQIRRAYQLAFGRDPRPVEMGAIEPVVREHGMPALCRVLLNSNEFLYIP